jgi:uncharacterized protein YhaN
MLPKIDGLPGSFAEELLSARTAKQNKEAEVQRLQSEHERLLEQMAACAPNATLLEQAAAIQQIHAHLGAYTTNKNSLARRQGEAATARENVDRMGKDLGITNSFENLEPLRITQILYAEAEEQAAVLKKQVGQVEKAEQRLAELARNLENRKATKVEVDEMRLVELKALRDKATQMQDKADTLPERRRALAQLEKALAESHRDLPGSPADHQQVCHLAVPSKASLERFRYRSEESERDIRGAKEGIKQIGRQVGDLKAEIEGLLRLQDIPDPKKLTQAREHRDRVWQMVLEDWKGTGAKEEREPGKPLQEAYPETVTAADQVADRLRSEANAVAQLSEKRLQMERQEQKLREEEAELNQLKQQAGALRQEWEEAWKACSITPQSPLEMQAWRDAWQEFRGGCNDREGQRAALEEDANLVEALTTAMADFLSSTESSFAILRRQIVGELESIEEAKVDGLAVQKIATQEQAEMAEINEHLGDLKSAREMARESWQKLASALSVPADVPAVRAVELLTGRRDLFREFDRHSGLANECSHLQTAIDAFEENVKEAATRTGLADAGIESLAQTLWKDFQSAQQAQQKLDTLLQSAVEKNHSLRQAQQELKALEEDFARRCTTANLEDATGVDAFAASFEEVQVHRKNIADLRESLAGLARGEAVDEFTLRVSQEEADVIDGELARLDQELKDLDQQQDDTRNDKQTITAKKATLERAGDEAARSEQLAQFEESRMLADAHRFIELQMALTLLKGQINQFRERNQGPFLTKASHWFSELTGEAFESIVTSFANGDEPTIAGRRRGVAVNEEVTIPAMSEGTRDQLYLALRLAGLELHLAEHAPMPLILDDLLVHFDDQRARHAIKALAGVSKQCQILLFTHHQHVVDLAKTTLQPEVFSVHQLTQTA